MTFTCGRAGVCALGAVVAKHTGDEPSLRYYLAQFEEVLNLCHICFMTFGFDILELCHELIICC